MPSVRSPICTVVGHVDHGKSTFLDRIRGTSIVDEEPGKITQAIGASIVPISTIRKICSEIPGFDSIRLSIEGMLFIDTPGHAAFSNLRKRGGTLADIAILVVDIKEGFKPQTIEALEMLKQFRVPFIVVANKIDLLPGWKIEKQDACFADTFRQQNDEAKSLLDQKIYELVGRLFEFGFNSERYDRVQDYTQQIAIVPVSAKLGVGIQETLMVIAGLAQKYLEKTLKLDVSGPGKGTILEVKNIKGIGCCLDVIIYEGILRVNDTVVIGGTEKPIVTKVRGIFAPAALSETRDKKSKFNPITEAKAAFAIRLAAPDLDGVIAGMPLRVATESNLEQVKEEIQGEVKEVIFETDAKGIIIKADTLGSLEAMMVMLRERNIPLRKAAVGTISKKDISDAESNYEDDPLQSAILGFNVELSPDLPQQSKVKVFTSNVIYQLIEDFEKWKVEEARRQESSQVDRLVRPCKIELMRNYVFRQSNPAIVGIEVSSGKLKAGMPLMKEGRVITSARSIQLEKETLNEAERGKQVALSMDSVTVGRQIHEGDFLYSGIPEEDFRKLKELKKYLTKDELDTMREIAEIMRKDNPLWGI